MGRVVERFPARGPKLAAVEPLLEECLDGKVHEFVRGEDWAGHDTPREVRARIQALARSHSFQTKTAVRGERIYVQIVGEIDG